MKNRLQALWDQVSPEGGPCPQPDAKAVRRRVDAALDKQPRAAHPWRALRLAAACAAALVLLTGTALAAGVLPLPDFNALSIFYNKGDNAPGAEGLVDTQPVTVSNDLFTVTLTSVLADNNVVYLTANIQGKDGWPQRYLTRDGFSPVFRVEHPSPTVCASPGVTHTWPYAADAKLRSVDMITAMTEDGRLAIHIFDPRGGPCMDGTCSGGDCRVEFTVTPRAETRTLEIDADGSGIYWGERGSFRGRTAPVHLQQVQLSPLSLRLIYLGPSSNVWDYVPALRFLWKDGTVSALDQTEVHLVSGQSSGSVNHSQFEGEGLWAFDSVQELSQMDAVIFEDTAYPLDGGAPYPVDADSLPRRQS